MSDVRISHKELRKFIVSIFQKNGSLPKEAENIAKYLIKANLRGHDSHGVVRVPAYIEWSRKKMVFANKHITIISKNGPHAVVDGNLGFGQIVAEEAVDLGICMARKKGSSMIAFRNAGHLGCIGDWALRAGDARLVSIHFVKSPSILTAPFGGRDRRLSSNPIAIGIPQKDGRHLVLDMATSKIAEGKIMVAKNNHTLVPQNTILDGYGRNTRNPNKFYKNPLGSILPFGEHKGYVLSIMCDILGGVLSGTGSSGSYDFERGGTFASGMFSIYINPNIFCKRDNFQKEIRRLERWIKKSSSKKSNTQGIFMPGEKETKIQQERTKSGIPLDNKTIGEIIKVAASVNVRQEFPGTSR